tara:strand:- start:104 stop:454 length:351 start_codon:yes stop_codon:yes gene_type:complete
MKLEVLVLEPDVYEDGDYKCDFCNISYCSSDYKSLFHSKKLIYLVVPYYLQLGEKDKAYSSSLDLCHSCFYTHLRSTSSKEPIEIVFLQGEKETIRFFDPQDEDLDNTNFIFLPKG